MKTRALRLRGRSLDDLKLAKGPRIGPSAVLIGDNIYVFGGAGKNGFRNDVDVISGVSGSDPQVTSFETELTRRLYISTATFGDDVYIFGGITYNGVIDIVEKFNVRTRTITKCAPMPEARRSTAAIASGNFIFVVGGSDKTGTGVPTLAVYNTKSDKWDKAPPMSVGRECTAALWSGLILVPGGYNGKTALPVCEAYSIGQARWTRMPDLPMPTSANHCAVSGDKLYSFGDYGQPDRALTLDLRRNRWSNAQTQPAYRASRHNAVVAVGKRVYVIAGNVNSADHGLDIVQVLTVG